jgi:hypothetical protein
MVVDSWGSGSIWRRFPGVFGFRATRHRRRIAHYRTTTSTSGEGAKMKTLFAMRRANGDWFALYEQGHLRVPIFRSTRDAMVARRRDTGMECFRPVALDQTALQNLTTTSEGQATFWLVADPLRNLNRSLALDRNEFEQFLTNLDEPPCGTGARR